MISSTVRKAGPFTGNGSASTFPFTFKVFTKNDLEVVSVAISTGAETTLTVDSDYTVSLNADQNSNPGGSITLTAGALATGYRLIISSTIEELQQTDLTNQGGFYPSVITDALDRLTILVQQLQEQVDRSLKYPTTDGDITSQLPSAEQRAGKLVYFGSDGSPTLVAAAPSGAALFSGTLQGTVNGTNQVFALTNNGSPLGRAPLQATVWCNFPLAVGVGYTLGPAAGQITFTNAPQVGDTLFAQGAF